MQQAAQTGRRNNQSLAMLVLERQGVDQYYTRNPEELFKDRGGGLAVIHLDLHNY
jgi:ATP-dependent helicase YprA (DUF1998 family)